MIMKKIVFALCIICIIVDLVLSLVSMQYMDLVKDVAMLLLAIMMSTHFFGKNEAGD